MSGVRRMTGVLVLAGGLTGAAGAVTRFRRHAGGDRATADRWLAVTIAREAPGIVPNDEYPEPLAALGDSVECRMRPARGDRGTELSARLRKSGTGSAGVLGRLTGADQHRDLRAALRKSKELIEAREVMSVDGQPEGRRPATVSRALIDLARRRSDKAGLL